MEGIGVREMGSPESLGGLFPRRIGSIATKQGLKWFILGVNGQSLTTRSPFITESKSFQH
jgi:hypothetical protein